MEPACASKTEAVFSTAFDHVHRLVGDANQLFSVAGLARLYPDQVQVSDFAAVKQNAKFDIDLTAILRPVVDYRR